MDRALSIKNNNIQPDIIFIQNVNDGNRKEDKFGEITDVPYMLLHNILIDTIYDSKSNAEDDFQNVIQNIDANIGTMIRIKYKTYGKRLIITGTAARDGDVQIIINGNTYGVSVTADMTISQIQESILAYDYSVDGYSDKKEDVDSIIFTDIYDRGSLSPTISFNPNNTGVLFELKDEITYNMIGKCFIGNVNSWSDMNKWIDYNNITNLSLYKGLISWIMTNFPLSKVYFISMPRIYWYSKGHELYENGIKNYDKWYKTFAWKFMAKKQKEICNYMFVRHLDVQEICGINIYNASYFYPEGNIHPNPEGYKRIGDVIANLVNAQDIT